MLTAHSSQLTAHSSQLTAHSSQLTASSFLHRLPIECVLQFAEAAMSDNYSYTTVFTIDKAHLIECYEQSVAVDFTILKYKRAIISLLFGVALLVLKLVSDYIAFFVISLGILEVFSTRYRKTWWLWRQMIGKSYNSKVTLLVDANGIKNHSNHVDQTIDWKSVTAVDKTAAGIIIRHAKGVSYLSNSCLDDVTIDYICNKPEAKS